MKKELANTSVFGFSKWNLDCMWRFNPDYADRLPRIVQEPSGQFAVEGIPNKLSDDLAQLQTCQKPSVKSLSGWFGQTVSDQFGKISQTPSAKLTIPERLSSKKNVIVELTLAADANIDVREYLPYLPSKEVLWQKLLDWVLEQDTGV